MHHVITTIVPIFSVIGLGWLLRHRGIISSQLLGPLNRLVYYLAIPAMIFREVASTSFAVHFQPGLVAATMAPGLVVFFAALGVGRAYGLPRSYMGTFLQSSFHGNLGYIGLAVCYYLLGSEGFARASILAGFLMLFQNLLSVFGLQTFSEKSRNRPNYLVKKVALNPVIGSAIGGMLFSVWGAPLPLILDRCLKIISSMALPLALLVIGGSMSFQLIRSHLRLALSAGALKLLILPACGLLLYKWLGYDSPQFLPGLILLATPTATITYVMGGEMQGSVELASASISINTLLSALTFIFWLNLVPLGF